MLNKAGGISTNPLKKKILPWSRGCRLWQLHACPSAPKVKRDPLHRHWPAPTDTCQSFSPVLLPPGWETRRLEGRREQGDLRNKPRCKVSPVFAQNRKRFPGRGLQWERQTTQFKDGNSALHHVFCSWDSEGPATRREIIKHKVATVCVPHHIRRYLLPSPV